MKVDRYVEPVEFEKWKEVAEGMGFMYVASGPLVRSSYKVPTSLFFLRVLHTNDRFSKAGEFYIENVLRGKAAQNKVKNLLAEESLNANVKLAA